MKHLAGNLKFLRRSRDLKQDEMLEQLGIKAATWSNYETGSTEPDLDNILKIADYFKVSLEDIVLRDLSKGLPEAPGDVWAEIRAIHKELDSIKRKIHDL